MKYSKYDVIIVGSGISGLFLANKLSQFKNFTDGVLLLTKEDVISGSSLLAQGGIVSVMPVLNKADSCESHIKDTLKAGCGVNDINTVKFISESSYSAIQDLISFGVEFDKNPDNTFNFTLEGAHSCPRILHAGGDSTGKVIETALADNILKSDNVEIYTNTMAVELLVDSCNTCRGLVAYNCNNNSYEAIYSNNVVIATGGIGQIYDITTNPSTSTGDGIALAYKAGANVENMEFVQFHPTALYCKDKTSLPLVSESVRGEGAKLRDIQGNYFAKNYHHDADLAPRDIVARAINSQMSINNDDFVYLDISQIGIEKFKKRFPTITSLCMDNNIDVSEGLIPVVPSQHYFMGGIKTDLNAKTSVENLYAIGECASSGLHGANRLASNSLLECVVFADVTAKNIMESNTHAPKMYDAKVNSIIVKYQEDNFSADENPQLIIELFNQLKKSMTKNAGIVRSKASLENLILDIVNIETGLNKSETVASKIKYELQNALCVAKLIAHAAMNRSNSIGAHYRSDEISAKSDNILINTESDSTYAKL